MSDQLFEVAFSGQISEGANLEEVKARVGKIFNADEAKLAQLFSGKRIVIKKNIDQATAAKYKTALNRAGAECEVSSSGGAAPAAPTAAPTAAAAPAESTVASTPSPAIPAESAAASTSSSVAYETDYDGGVEPPPQTDPLGITGDQIEDLAVSIAPVGSELQDSYVEAEDPQIDITGLDVAPVGSDIGSTKKDPEPPLPDTSGITLAE
jgi:hypothetical protein